MINFYNLNILKNINTSPTPKEKLHQSTNTYFNCVEYYFRPVTDFNRQKCIPSDQIRNIIILLKI